MNQEYQFENEDQCCAYKLAACRCDCASPMLGGNVLAKIQNVELLENKLHITLGWSDDTTVESYTVIPNSLDSPSEITTETSYTVITSWPSAPNRLNIDIFSKKKQSEDCTDDSCVPGYLAGSKVIMADLSEKPIEEVVVGEYVMGAFGNMNRVQAIHTCVAGDKFFTRINNTLVVPLNTVFVDDGKKLRIRCAKTALNGYARFEHVIDHTGCIQQKHNYGIESKYINALVHNIKVKTLDESKNIDFIEECRIDPNTKLYSIAVSGCHTHFIDNYAVGGWPNSYDFDYDAWMPKYI